MAFTKHVPKRALTEPRLQHSSTGAAPRCKVDPAGLRQARLRAMTEREPTNAELLAASAAIALEGRRMVERTDRTSYRDTCETLDALHEHMAVAGGSLLILADRLGCKADVERMLRDGRARVDAFCAYQGLGGRA